jgi:hypothetical protein
MSRNSSGTYSRVTPPGPAGYVGGAGNKIYASQVNGEYNDISAEITDSVSRSGKGAALANLPMGGFKHTGAASSAANGEYVEHSQIVTLSADIMALLAALEPPVGTVHMFYGNVAPVKWVFLTAGTYTVSRATYAELFDLLITNAGYTDVSFTVTISASASVTSPAHGFTGGEMIRLSTSGALPTGLNTSRDYFVKYKNVDEFNLSLTLGGVNITTSGTQSGLHTYKRTDWGNGDGSTTFNMPFIEQNKAPVNTVDGANAGTTGQTATITGAIPAASIKYIIKVLP